MPDYSKWDSLTVSDDDDDAPARPDGRERALGSEVDPDGLLGVRWSQRKHGELRATVPLAASATGRQCRVEFKRNWLKVVAPPLNPAATPAGAALLDFQLHGAVDPERCDWRIERSARGVVLLLELQKSPIYDWPTLHRVNGLRSESDRAAALDRLRQEADQTAAMAQAANAHAEAMPDGERAAAPGCEPGPIVEVAETAVGQPQTLRPPGVYEGGRVIVSAAPGEE